MDGVRGRFLRSADGQLGGVASGLAQHLGVSVVLVRVAFVGLALYQGFGLLLYLAYWAIVPRSHATTPASRTWADPWPAVAVAVGAAGVGLALVVQVPSRLAWPALVAVAGLALVWRQADDTDSRGLRRAGVAVLLVGLALLVGGLASIASAQGRDPGGFAVTAAVLVVAAAAGLPWWRRLAVDLRVERRARIRSQERAEVAAHLHDSVLQTLTLIQRQVDSPRDVQRLARRQERELRDWLYGRTGAASTLASTVRAAADEVEDEYGVVVDLVVVGDAPMDDRVAALAKAAREAMVNAARHSGCETVSAYVEVDANRATIYVRDRGTGFDPARTAPGRHGLVDSVVGRMQRHGGRAAVHSSPGAGTEVELEMPR